MTEGSTNTQADADKSKAADEAVDATANVREDGGEEEDDAYGWILVVDSFTDSQGWIYGTSWDRN